MMVNGLKVEWGQRDRKHEAQSGINIVNEIMRRGVCDRQHASSSQSISIALRFWRICLTHSFFPYQSLIVCKIWSMYLCHGQAAYPRKKKKKMSLAIDVYDRRESFAMNIEDSYLSFISDSFIIRILFAWCLWERVPTWNNYILSQR